MLRDLPPFGRRSGSPNENLCAYPANAPHEPSGRRTATYRRDDLATSERSGVGTASATSRSKKRVPGTGWDQ